MKIAAAVILYHPTEETVTNIQSYYSFVDKVYVFDNSENDSVIKSQLLQLANVQFYQDYSNEGIAIRLNEACNKALNDKFEWLLTMDQDSCFSENAIKNYFQCFQKYPTLATVAAFGPMFSREKAISLGECESRDVNKLITSGTLLNLAIFQTIGGFDNNLFIDSVDYDYCLRAKMKSYSIIQFSNIHLLHTVGNEVFRASIKTLYLLKKKKEIHSPLRCYYMYRNMLYLKDKYKNKDKRYFKEIKDYVLSRLKVCLLYGRSTLEIIKYIQLAKKDYEDGYMGKIRIRL